MKKGRLTGMGMLCTVLLLSGCQPTTDKAIVEPKSAIAGAKMVDEAAVGNVPEQVQAPATCTLQAEAEDGTVVIDGEAKVTVPEVDGIRLKKVETRVFRQSDMDNIKENLLQGNPLEQRICTDKQRDENIRWTREEVGEIIKLEEAYGARRYLEAEKYGWGSSYVDDQLNWWYEQMDVAPESFKQKEASTKILYDKYAAERFLSDQGSTANANIIWGGTVLDGQIYNFVLNNNWSSEFKNVTANLVKGYYYKDYGEWNLYTSESEYFLDSYMLDEGTEEYDAAMAAIKEEALRAESYDMDQETYDGQETETEEKKNYSYSGTADIPGIKDEWILKTPLEELKAKGDALTDALGLEEMELAAYKKCGIYDGYLDMSMSAVNLIYTPVVDGVPVTYVDYRYTYDNETTDYSESFQAAYDDEGLAQVKWQNPSKIYDMSDEYVFLLPFSDVLKTFQEQAPELHRIYGEEETIRKEIHITEIRLGYMWVPDESTEMEGMLIPVWDFMGYFTRRWLGNEEQGIDPSWNVNTSPYQSFLTVNAMDGTVMEGTTRPY